MQNVGYSSEVSGPSGCNCNFRLIWRFFSGGFSDDCKRLGVRLAEYFSADSAEQNSVWLISAIDGGPKARNANALVAEPEPKEHFNAKWSFKVIYFGVTEEPLSISIQ